MEFSDLFESLSPAARARKLIMSQIDMLRGQQEPQQPPQPNLSAGNDFGMGTSPAMPPPEMQAPAQAPARAQALPQAMGRVRTAPQPQSVPSGPPAALAGQPAADPYGIDKLEAERKAAFDAQDKLMQPPDRTAAEEAYRKRAASSGKYMALALLANEAKLEPFSAQHLKQAAEARAPMKMAGGTMTDEGFIEDPAYQQELQLRRADGRLKQVEQALQGALSRQERARLEKEQQAAQAALQQERLAAQSFIANQAHLDRMAALSAKGTGGGQGKILPVKTVSDLTEGQNKLTSMTRLHQEFDPSYAGPGGAVSRAAGQYIPGLDTKSAEWWRNYAKEASLVERHGLFGASLTPGEAASWKAADINPSMSPEAIQRNLARRQEILQQKYEREVGNLGGSGYNTEAFQQRVNAPPAAPPGGGGGRVIVNPQTGQRLREVNGQWVPA